MFFFHKTTLIVNWASNGSESRKANLLTDIEMFITDIAATNSIRHPAMGAT